MNFWYINLKEKINELMKKNDFSNYTIILTTTKVEKVISSNLEINSIETKETQGIIFQIYHKNKYYKYSLTGFDSLEEEINNIKNVIENLEENDYIEENIYHSPVYLEEKQPTLKIDEGEREIKTIQNIIKNYKDVFDDILQIAIYKEETFIFNGIGYENYSLVEYGDIYISLCYNSKNGTMESEWDYLPLKKSMNWNKIIEELVNNMKIYENKITLETGSYPILFPNKVASVLTDLIVSALYGDNIWHKKSFISKENLDKKIFSPNINILENPNLPNSIFNNSADCSGTDIKQRYLVKEGSVKGFLLNGEYGKKLNMKQTGNSWFGAIGYTNIYMENGTYTYEELIKTFENNVGIVVMEI